MSSLNFLKFCEIFDYKYPSRLTINIDKEKLLIGMNIISSENLLFEGLHVSLYKKDNPDLFLNQVWESFLEYHKEFFKYWLTGIPLTRWNKKPWPKRTIKERKEQRAEQWTRLRELFLNDYIILKFCPHCSNFQIYNRLKRGNKCGHCKDARTTHSKDKQFFSNLSLILNTKDLTFKGEIQMKAVCPNNKDHKRFITVAHIAQEWVVDENGNFQEVYNQCTDTVAQPDPGNIWECKECGAEAIVMTD